MRSHEEGAVLRPLMHVIPVAALALAFVGCAAVPGSIELHWTGTQVAALSVAAS